MTNAASSSMLDIAKLHANPNARVIILHPGNTKSTIAVTESDFGFSMSSQFTSEDQQGADPLSDTTNKISNTFGLGAQTIVANIRQTASQWTGSTRPTFSIPITVVAYDTSIKPLDISKEFLKGVAFEYGMAGVFKAPNGYGVTKLDAGFGNSSFTGTWSLQIGQWFRATGLILLDATVQYSKEVLKTTKQPVWATINLTFQPCILPDKETVASWFLV